jgi:hypothetical protein
VRRQVDHLPPWEHLPDGRLRCRTPGQYRHFAPRFSRPQAGDLIDLIARSWERSELNSTKSLTAYSWGAWRSRACSCGLKGRFAYGQQPIVLALCRRGVQVALSGEIVQDQGPLEKESALIIHQCREAHDIEQSIRHDEHASDVSKVA